MVETLIVRQMEIRLFAKVIGLINSALVSGDGRGHISRFKQHGFPRAVFKGAGFIVGNIVPPSLLFVGMCEGGLPSTCFMSSTFSSLFRRHPARHGDRVQKRGAVCLFEG